MSSTGEEHAMTGAPPAKVPRRRSFTFSLRRLMAAVLVLGAIFGAATAWIASARAQRETIAEIRWRGGMVWYDWMIPARDANVLLAPEPPAPRWLIRLVGEDALYSPVDIDITADRDPDRVLALIGRLTTLEGLTLWSPPAKPASFRRLRALPRLKRLQICTSSRGEIPLDFLDGMKSLQSLNFLSPHTSTDADLAHLAPLRDLRKLVLKSRSITDQGIFHLRHLSKLRVLSLDGAAVTNEGLNHLAGMTELRALGVSESQITDLSPLRDLHKITHLSINGNPIGDDGLRSLNYFPQLISLSLENTRIDDRGLRNLEFLTSLRLLGLRRTDVGDAGLVHLVKLPKLRFLDLDMTKVTDAGLSTIAAMPNCKEISLQGVRLSTSAIATLRAARTTPIELRGYESVGWPAGVAPVIPLRDTAGESIDD